MRSRKTQQQNIRSLNKTFNKKNRIILNKLVEYRNLGRLILKNVKLM